MCPYCMLVFLMPMVPTPLRASPIMEEVFMAIVGSLDYPHFICQDLGQALNRGLDH